MTTQHRSVLPAIRKVLTFPLIRVPVLGGILFVGMGISNGFMQTYWTSPLVALALVLLLVSLALLIYGAFVRFVENRPVTELSMPGAGTEFARGFLLGFGLYAATVLVLVLLGYYRIEGLNPWTALLPFLALAVSSAFFEELIYRGVLFRVAEDYLGTWIALIATAAFFGARHLGNPDATLTGAIFIAIEAGILLAAAYMLTRRLWLPIGLHMAWNFAEAAVFSGAVSGVDMPPGLVQAVIAGPELMTGGKFGIEASIVAFLLCTGTGALLVWTAARRGQIRPPMWAKHA